MFILPFNRDNFAVRTPWVVLGIIAINCLVFIPTNLYLNRALIFQQYGFIPASPHLQSIFSSMFLHSGFWHIAGNMFFLWMFGVRVENALGRTGFLLFYLVCGLGATGLYYASHAGSMIPCVGASGAISGVAGAYFVLFPGSQFDLDIYLGWWQVKTYRTHTRAAVGTWFLEQAALGLLAQMGQFSSVAFLAHAGGFVTGLTLAWLFAASTARGGYDGEPALFFTTTVLVPACDVHAMVRWYTEKLNFRQVGIDEDDLESGPEAALKPGGDGEPLLLRRRAEQLPKATIEMFALDLHRVRKVLQARGVMTHLAGGEFSGPNYLWFEDVEGNTVKIIEKRFLG